MESLSQSIGQPDEFTDGDNLGLKCPMCDKRSLKCEERTTNADSDEIVEELEGVFKESELTVRPNAIKVETEPMLGELNIFNWDEFDEKHEAVEVHIRKKNNVVVKIYNDVKIVNCSSCYWKNFLSGSLLVDLVHNRDQLKLFSLSEEKRAEFEFKFHDGPDFSEYP